MHYRNGREAKNGDIVLQFGFYGGKITALGVLHSTSGTDSYCNGQLALVHGPVGACLVDCLHIEDVATLLKEKGLDKRPQVK